MKRKRKPCIALVIALTLIAGISFITIEDSFGAVKPKAPAITSLSSTSYSLSLKWKSVYGADGYEIYSGTEKLATVEGKLNTSKTLSDISPETKYSLKVRGFDKYKVKQWYNKKTKSWTGKKPSQKYRGKSRYIAKYKYGSFSSVKTITTKAIPKVENIFARYADKQVSISWDSVKKASSYVVLRSDGRSFTACETSYADKAVEKGRHYRYQVAAVVNGKTGAFSSYSTIINIPIGGAGNTGLEIREDWFIDYSKDGDRQNVTRMYVGQPWTESLNASLNGGQAIEPLLRRDYTNTAYNDTLAPFPTYLYCYDTEDFDNFLIVYVLDDTVFGWLTSAKEAISYEGTVIETGRSALDYPQFQNSLQHNELWIVESKVAGAKIYMAGILGSGSVINCQPSMAISDDLEAEELLCMYTSNMAFVKNGQPIRTFDPYLYGTDSYDFIYNEETGEGNYGAKGKAWGISEAEIQQNFHAYDSGNGKRTRVGSERESWKAVKLESCDLQENAALGNSGGELVTMIWISSPLHENVYRAYIEPSAFMTGDDFLAAAVCKAGPDKEYAWFLQTGFKSYNVKVEEPVITIDDVSQKYIDIHTNIPNFTEEQKRYCGGVRVELWKEGALVKGATISCTDLGEVSQKFRNLSPDTEYTIRAAALSGGGTELTYKDEPRTAGSFWSEWVTVSTLPEPTIDEPIVPLTQAGDYNIKVKPETVNSDYRYQVEVSTDENFENVIKSYSSKFDSGYVPLSAEEIVPESTYYLRMRAYLLRSGEETIYSQWSETVSVTTTQETPIVNNAYNITVPTTGTTTNSIRLSIPAATKDDTFYIQMSTDENFENIIPIDGLEMFTMKGSNSTQNKIISGLDETTTYYFKTRAKTKDGEITVWRNFSVTTRIEPLTLSYEATTNSITIQLPQDDSCSYRIIGLLNEDKFSYVSAYVDLILTQEDLEEGYRYTFTGLESGTNYILQMQRVKNGQSTSDLAEFPMATSN